MGSRRIIRQTTVLLLLLLLLVGGVFTQFIFGKSGYYRNAGNRHSNTTTGVVWPASTDPRGSCVQCHTTHTGTNAFGLRAANNNSFCYTCHAGNYQRSWTSNANYGASAHGLSVLTYDPKTGAGTGRQVKLCIQCHNPHGNGDATNGFRLSLQEYREENTCFGNNTAGTAGNGCHGQNAGYRPTNANDVYTQFLKATTHPLTLGDPNVTRRHSANETQSIGWNPASNRHVECADCHNPHRARSGTHAPPTKVLSNALLGTWGVEPSWPGNWGNVTSYTVKNFINDPPLSTEHEYQLCLKCHSYYAYTNTPPTGYTDQAKEFNKNNPSYHIVGQTTTRSAGMPNVANSGFNRTVYNWNSSSPMYCSDCHSEETTTATLATNKGAHGSTNNKLLWGVYNGDTGKNSAGGKGDPDTDTHLCFKCHDYALYTSDSTQPTVTGFSEQNYNKNLHRKHVKKGITCWNCHIKIPHGWKRPHMLAHYPDKNATTAPYFGVSTASVKPIYAGKWVYVDVWSPSGNWNKDDCITSHDGGGGQAACK